MMTNTLTETYYQTYQQDALALFKETLTSLLETLDLNSWWNDLSEMVKGEQSLPEGVELVSFGQEKSVRVPGEAPEQYIELTPRDKKTPWANTKSKLGKDLFSLHIHDHLNYDGVTFYFNDSLSYLVVERTEDILFEMCDETVLSYRANDFSYLLWLLAVLGDFFYDFNDEDEDSLCLN